MRFHCLIKQSLAKLQIKVNNCEKMANYETLTCVLKELNGLFRIFVPEILLEQNTSRAGPVLTRLLLDLAQTFQ